MFITSPYWRRHEQQHSTVARRRYLDGVCKDRGQPCRARRFTRVYRDRLEPTNQKLLHCFGFGLVVKILKKPSSCKRKFSKKKIFFDSRTKIISRLIHLILTNTRPVLAEASVVVLPLILCDCRLSEIKYPR
jgi:hypothetical protein